MHIISVLSVLLIVTNTLANSTEIKKVEEEINLKDSEAKELDAITSTATDEVNKRSKKSTTTTFCVEIRPSGPFQKPFQVCEPAEPPKSSQPTSSQTYATYYSPPGYTTQDQPKPEAYKLPTQPKPDIIYSAPVKTYAPATTPPPKQFAAHGMSYSTYRSKAEDNASEAHNGHMMRMTAASDEDQDRNAHLALMADQQMRSASYGSSSYGSRNYGAASSYVPVIPNKSEKHRSHNGLVITCQPNLAGYAHNVPSSLHHPPALHSYSYRSSTPRGYSGKYGSYQVQSHGYGSYPQSSAYKVTSNDYKSPAAAYQHASAATISRPTQQYGPTYSQPTYSPPAAMYSTSSQIQSNVADIHPNQPPVHVSHLAPQLQPPQSYAHYSQSYAQASSSAAENIPSPAYGPLPTSLGPAPAPYAPVVAPGYGPAAPPVSAPTSYSQSQSYTSNVPHAPAPVPAPQPQSYVSTGTYREADGDSRMQAAHMTDSQSLQHDKEKHTLQKMEELSHQKVASSQWSSEMSKEKMSTNKSEEHVKSSQGWSAKMRASEKADEMESESNLMKKNHEAENEVK